MLTRKQIKSCLVISAVCMVATGSYFVMNAVLLKRVQSGNVTQSLSSIFKACSTELNKQLCYQRAVLGQQDFLGMVGTFELVSQIQNIDPAGIPNCHGIGHSIASHEVAKNPSLWSQVLTQCTASGSLSCQTGCLHGAFLGGMIVSSSKVISRSLALQLRSACQALKIGHENDKLDVACFHGLGHLSLYIADSQLSDALAMCDRITQGALSSRASIQCFDGVFMELFQPQSREDSALVFAVAPKTQHSATSFCSSFVGNARDVCNLESWPLYGSALFAPDNIVSFCSKLSVPNRTMCVEQLLSTATLQSNFNVPTMQQLCDGFTTQLKVNCFVTVSIAAIHSNPLNRSKAIRFCHSVSSGCPK